MANEVIGYARTSTLDQIAGFEDQIHELTKAGCMRIYREQVSAMGERPQLAACLEYVREGDCLMVTKPDRLARSTLHLLEIVATLNRKKVNLVIRSMGGQAIDTRTPTGKVLITLLGAIAEFERELMLERMRAGIAKAKLEGKYKGRAPTARRQIGSIHLMRRQGLRAEEIAAHLGIHRASVFRALKMPDPGYTNSAKMEEQAETEVEILIQKMEDDADAAAGYPVKGNPTPQASQDDAQDIPFIDANLYPSTL